MATSTSSELVDAMGASRMVLGKAYEIMDVERQGSTIVTVNSADSTQRSAAGEPTEMQFLILNT